MIKLLDYTLEEGKPITTIAWDGTTLSGDGLILEDNKIIMVDYVKVRKYKIKGKTIICGGAGDVTEMEKFFKWAKTGFTSKSIKFNTPSNFTGIAIASTCPDIVQEFSNNDWCTYKCSKYAIGSGADYARAILHLNKSSHDAVYTASQLEVGTNNNITKVEL